MSDIEPQKGIMYHYHPWGVDAMCTHYCISHDTLWSDPHQPGVIPPSEPEFTPYVDLCDPAHLSVRGHESVIDPGEVMLCIGDGIQVQNGSLSDLPVMMYPMLIRGLRVWMPGIFAERMYEVTDEWKGLR